MGEKQSERHARDLAAIKAREQAVREALKRGDPTVDTGSFTPAQLGLASVYADERGQLWRLEYGGKARRIRAFFAGS